MKKLAPLFILLLAVAACKGPTALFTTDKGEYTAPALVQFENKGADLDSVHWKFGDGKSSTEFNPVHQYTASGHYKVTLKVMKGKKEATFSQHITINPPEDNLVEIITPYGTMIARLSDGTPQHRDNFLKLVDEGFYNDLLFHRVIPEFMIQGGDPASRGAGANQPLGGGGPGYTIEAEIMDSLVHTRGALAAARTGDVVNPERRSSGSQFYIVGGTKFAEESLENILKQSNVSYSPQQIEMYQKYGGTPFLDGQYTVFGYVISGFDVIDKIANVKRNRQDRPLEDVKMTIKRIQ